MDLSYALAWMIGTSAVFGLVRSIREFRVGLGGWFWVHCAMLVVLGTGAWLAWKNVGYLALLLWSIFVVGPESAARRMREALQRPDATRATFWARVAAWTHPFDGLPQQARLLASHSYLDRGDVEAAKGALYPLLAEGTWSEIAKLELLQLDERWAEIAAHAGARAVGTRDLRLAPLYLKALGEIGDLDAMWTMYGQLPAALATQPPMRLLMASYSGLTRSVEELVTRRFQSMPGDLAELIRVTAAYRSGATAEAERRLTAIIHSGSARAKLAKRRLTHPLSPAKLDRLARHHDALAHFEDEVRLESSPRLHFRQPRRAWATLALIFVLVAVFAAAIPGGSTNPENLVRLGALVVPSELTGGGTLWRIVAAGFLHLGTTHLLMNCLGLWVLGAQIERLWNGLTMLGVFLTSSVGSFAIAATFVVATPADPRIFLGASSGVLGLVGAFGCFLATGYSMHRGKAIGQRFLLVLAVVFAQLVFDWFTPIVSSMLHLTGLGIGAVVALPLSIAHWRRG